MNHHTLLLTLIQHTYGPHAVAYILTQNRFYRDAVADCFIDALSQPKEHHQWLASHS